MGLPDVKFHDGWPVARAADARPRRANRRLSGSRQPTSRWVWLALATFVLLLTPTIVLAVLADHYQPLRYGDSGYTNEYFRGLPTGQGIHLVNTVGGLHQDFYIPPQRGVFSLSLDIANRGSRPVIIEAVRLQSGGPLWAAGPARYAWQTQSQPMTKPHVLRHVRLGPHQDVLVGLPVRTWSCASKYGWASVPFVYVTEKFGPFTHTVALPWGMQNDELVLHIPDGPHITPGPGAICAAR